MLDLLRQIGEGVLTLVNSLLNLVSWIPLMMRFSLGSSGFLGFIPSTLVPVAIVSCSFYVLKVVIYGSDNK